MSVARIIPPLIRAGVPYRMLEVCLGTLLSSQASKRMPISSSHEITHEEWEQRASELIESCLKEHLDLRQPIDGHFRDNARLNRVDTYLIFVNEMAQLRIDPEFADLKDEYGTAVFETVKTCIDETGNLDLRNRLLSAVSIYFLAFESAVLSGR